MLGNGLGRSSGAMKLMNVHQGEEPGGTLGGGGGGLGGFCATTIFDNSPALSIAKYNNENFKYKT